MKGQYSEAGKERQGSGNGQNRSHRVQEIEPFFPGMNQSRHSAQDRHLQVGLQVVRLAKRCVEILEQEDETCPESDSSPDDHDEQLFHVRLTGSHGNFGRVQYPELFAFLLLFRFSEAQLVKLAAPFMLDSPEVGGLALSTGQVGFVYGTIGVIMLTLGGLLGGFVAARHGLKHWIFWNGWLPFLRPSCWSVTLNRN